MIKAVQIGPHTIIVNEAKTELMEAMDKASRDMRTLVETGDPEIHKRMTFALRYGRDYAKNDKRVYSRDSEEIKAYWRERLYPKPVLVCDNTRF